MVVETWLNDEFDSNVNTIGNGGRGGTVAVVALCDTPLVTVCRVAAAVPDDKTPLVEDDADVPDPEPVVTPGAGDVPEDVPELTVPVCVPGADAVPVLPVVTATRLVRESVAAPVVTAADDVTDDAAAAAVADVALSLVGSIACDVTG